PPPTTTAARAPSGQDVHWSVLAVLAGGAAFAVLVLVAAHLRGRDAPPLRRGPLAGALAGGIEDLESEPDPRRAVIKAYARMEVALAQEGLPRRASETPLEYLRRGVGRLHGGARPLARL